MTNLFHVVEHKRKRTPPIGFVRPQIIQSDPSSEIVENSFGRVQPTSAWREPLGEYNNPTVAAKQNLGPPINITPENGDHASSVTPNDDIIFVRTVMSDMDQRNKASHTAAQFRGQPYLDEAGIRKIHSDNSHPVRAVLRPEISQYMNNKNKPLLAGTPVSNAPMKSYLNHSHITQVRQIQRQGHLSDLEELKRQKQLQQPYVHCQQTAVSSLAVPSYSQRPQRPVQQSNAIYPGNDNTFRREMQETKHSASYFLTAAGNNVSADANRKVVHNQHLTRQTVTPQRIQANTLHDRSKDQITVKILPMTQYNANPNSNTSSSLWRCSSTESLSRIMNITHPIMPKQTLESVASETRQQQPSIRQNIALQSNTITACPPTRENPNYRNSVSQSTAANTSDIVSQRAVSHHHKTVMENHITHNAMHRPPNNLMQLGSNSDNKTAVNLTYHKVGRPFAAPSEYQKYHANYGNEITRESNKYRSAETSYAAPNSVNVIKLERKEATNANSTNNKLKESYPISNNQSLSAFKPPCWSPYPPIADSGYRPAIAMHQRSTTLPPNLPTPSSRSFESNSQSYHKPNPYQGHWKAGYTHHMQPPPHMMPSGETNKTHWLPPSGHTLNSLSAFNRSPLVPKPVANRPPNYQSTSFANNQVASIHEANYYSTKRKQHQQIAEQPFQNPNGQNNDDALSAAEFITNRVLQSAPMAHTKQQRSTTAEESRRSAFATPTVKEKSPKVSKVY